MASGPIPVAVIGFGSSARTFHLPLLLSNPAFVLHTIQQRPGSTSGPPAHAAFPDAYTAPSLEDVLDGPKALPKPGLVVITTANATHVDFAKKALNAGLHVVVEKPVALTLEDAKALQSLAAEKGLICTAFQNRRLDNDFLTLQALLAPTSSGDPSAIGEPVSVESRFDRFRPLRKGGWREEKGWEEGGGVLWDLGAHLVDQSLAQFGTPERITAFVTSGRDASHNVEDDFLVHLHYAPGAPLPPDSVAPPPGTRLGGLRVTLGASCLASRTDDEQCRWAVCGTRGSYEKRGLDPQENQLKAGLTPKDSIFGSYGPNDSPSIVQGRLTTSAAPSASAQAAATPSAPVQPVLAAQDIPTLPGRYADYYANVAAAVAATEAARSQGAESAAKAGQDVIMVKLEHFVDNTKALLLARKSATEERTVKWSEL